MRRFSSLGTLGLAVLATFAVAALTTAAVVDPPANTASGDCCAASASCSTPGCTADHAAGEACSVGGSCATGAVGANHCADFGACSLQADLMKASGAELAAYAKEKERDGERFDDLALAPFEAKDLAGEHVSSKDLIGQPTLVAFLAAHCGHCFVSLPMLNDLQADYTEAGLKVVGVYVNSGNGAQVHMATASYRPEFTIWTHPETDIGESIDSHLVPTYLLVDAKGQVQQKFVSFKTRDELDKGLHEALGLSTARDQVGR